MTSCSVSCGQCAVNSVQYLVFSVDCYVECSMCSVDAAMYSVASLPAGGPAGSGRYPGILQPSTEAGGHLWTLYWVTLTPPVVTLGHNGSQWFTMVHNGTNGTNGGNTGSCGLHSRGEVFRRHRV